MTFEHDKEHETARIGGREVATAALLLLGWCGITAGCAINWGAGTAFLAGGGMLLAAGILADWRS